MTARTDIQKLADALDEALNHHVTPSRSEELRIPKWRSEQIASLVNDVACAWANTARSSVTLQDDTEPRKDGCVFCRGAKGGTPGNENRIRGQIVCDYCTSILMDMGVNPSVVESPPSAPPPKRDVPIDITANVKFAREVLDKDAAQPPHTLGRLPPHVRSVISALADRLEKLTARIPVEDHEAVIADRNSQRREVERMREQLRTANDRFRNVIDVLAELLNVRNARPWTSDDVIAEVKRLQGAHETVLKAIRTVDDVLVKAGAYDQGQEKSRAAFIEQLVENSNRAECRCELAAEGLLRSRDFWLREGGSKTREALEAIDRALLAIGGTHVLVVDGKSFVWSSRAISYADICSIADPRPSRTLSVVYTGRRDDGTKHDGVLAPGQEVVLLAGYDYTFKVAHTGGA